MWDAVFVPGVRSDPNKLKGVSPNSTQTRTDDKKSLHDISHTAITTIREFAVQQVNGAAIQSELKGARHVIDPKSILTLASKILLKLLMAAGVLLPQALQLISGVPLMKVASVFAEKLSITKRLDGGPGLNR